MLDNLNINRPDYRGGSLVNLMMSLKQGLGAPVQGYSECRALQDITLNNYNNLVLLVVDGLGLEYVQATGGLYRSHCRDQLTSVFPSTTATSITTFLTGQAPQQHGLTGWFTYLEEVDEVTAVLPCTIRGSQENLADRGVDIDRLYQHPSFFDELKCQSVIISPDWILKSRFNQGHQGRAQTRGYTGLDDMFKHMADCVKMARQRQYLYAYWPEFDHLSHVHGNQSEIVADHFVYFQKATEKFLIDIKGTNSLVLITADHGFIDTTPEQRITVNDYPQLQACLRLPLSGEPRTAYCYIHEDKRDTFVDYVNNEFSDLLYCVPSTELIEANFFGLGEPHAQLAKRVGDFTLLMKDSFTIKDWLDNEKPFFHYGVHGGVSDSEMFVPLIILEP